MFDNNYLEDEIYSTCDENHRDFTQEEVDYINSREDVRKILLDWFENDISVNCWTQKNQEFMKSFLSEKEDACFLGFLIAVLNWIENYWQCGSILLALSLFHSSENLLRSRLCLKDLGGFWRNYRNRKAG